MFSTTVSPGRNKQFSQSQQGGASGVSPGSAAGARPMVRRNEAAFSYRGVALRAFQEIEDALATIQRLEGQKKV
jgi:hypothetical protein